MQRRNKTAVCLHALLAAHCCRCCILQAVLFGGCGGEQTAINCLNDVWAFDLELHRWDKVELSGDGGEVPAARASFGMCAGTMISQLCRCIARSVVLPSGVFIRSRQLVIASPSSPVTLLRHVNAASCNHAQPCLTIASLFTFVACIEIIQDQTLTL
jgi:hypothetical protein